MNLRRDPGAYIRYHDESLMPMGSFMTPTLRELKQTGPPYMHNGMFDSLFEVVNFYDQGGGRDEHKDALVKPPLNLTFSEKNQLVAFLESLSGDVLNGPDFVPEEVDTEYPVIENWRKARN